MRRPVLLVSAVVAVVAGAVVPTSATAAPQPPGITVTKRHEQPIDGFGYATAFGRAQLVRDLPAATRKKVTDLLLGRGGAAPGIIRLGISSTASSIEPTDPGGPSARPQYVWNGDDDGQVWFAKQAQRRGVRNFYADAWSAPGFMKDTGSEANGGTLCGLTGVTCASGDWTKAYAKYLVRYADFYRQEGIRIRELGMMNEPDYTASYSSMRLTPEQAAQLAAIVGPVAHRAGYDLACCDAFGWTQAAPYARAIAANPAAKRAVDVLTGHSYASRSDVRIPTAGKRAWMSEWAPSSTKDGWNTAWDSGKATDGIAIAEHIQDTMTKARASGYLFWYGVSSGGTAALLQVDPETQAYSVSARYYAFSAFSRFVRPGADRLAVRSATPDVEVSAYRNRDGSKVVEILNLGTATASTSLAGIERSGASAYLTDNGHGLSRQRLVTAGPRGATAVRLPGRSLVTVVTR